MNDNLTTPRELMDEMMRLSRLVDAGVAELIKQSREYAEAENEYRKAKAVAWFVSGEGTVKAKEAAVDRECEQQRGRKLLAEGMRLAALEAVRSRRAQMSALQTVSNALKAEMDLATYTKG